MGSDERTPLVVVGVDGSSTSYEALRWAVRYARLIGATVVVVAAYDVSSGPGWAPPSESADVNTSGIKQDLAEQVARVIAETGEMPQLEQRLVEGDPATALIRASAGAEALVVGSRGRGGLLSLLLGSVSRHCAVHAGCPVVVVRPGVTEDDEVGARVGEEPVTPAA
ncbi:universal stress protein [Streptomyces sp. NPDC051555]|uniref:universal stress protein n=1 Tax=Streptomyces sp. NPDC051555 TaxID=3365657 RepID=UPI0037A89C0A